MSISASWLVLAVLLLRLFFKKAPRWISCLMWSIVAVRLIMPFSFESTLSLIPSAETISPEIMMDWTPEVSTGIDSLDTVVNPIITGSFAPKPYASANPLQILIPVCGNLWILGILVILAYTAVSYILLRRKVATAVLLKKNIYQSEKDLVKSILRMHEHGHHGGKHPQSDTMDSHTLSAREIEVLVLVTKGLINKEIAEKLNISLTTVISHRKNITEKLGIKSVAGLTIYAVMNGYIEADSI